MKKYILLTIAVAFITACKGGPQEMIPGGWTEQKPTAEFVKKAYEFAAKKAPEKHKGIKLLSPVKAQSQIVEGTNIRMECPYELAGKKGTASILVFEALNGSYQLTSIVLSP